MHNNHGGRGSPGGHTAVHHHHQGRILPRNRRALMCIDKHDDNDVQARPPHAKINQVRAPIGNKKRRTTDTYPS